jgi:hypothetical protein
MDISDGRQDFENIFSILEDTMEFFSVWQSCQDAHADETTVEMFNESYFGVLHWIERAMISQSINSLYSLNEKRGDTLNFNTLLAKYKDSLSTASYQELASKVNELKPLWVKLAILRNEIFAHRTNERGLDESFNKADMTPGQIMSYIKLCQFVIQRFGVLRFGVTYQLTSGSKPAMDKLISDLRSNYAIKGTSA